MAFTFGAHTCVVALGIDRDGRTHPLALVEGATENATLVRALLVDLGERGLDVTRPLLVVIDGARALRSAVVDVFDRPLIQRCQEYKIRNVQDRLPVAQRSVVEQRMRRTYQEPGSVGAEAQLEALARELAADRSVCGGEPP